MNEMISIIIPIYNVEKYLIQCIESVINQTYQNLEIILVDDGSPDNCGKICDEYAKKDARIKVIHKENGGLSSARNAGLELAKGEYISFIDSDDYVSCDFVKKLYQLCKDYNADIAECNFQKFDDKVYIEKNKKEVITVSSNQMQHNLFNDNYLQTVVVWNKLYKKYIYENLRFPNGKINEDEFTSYKAFHNCEGNIVISSEKLYYYRYNAQSIMGRKFNSKRLDALQAWEEQKEFYIIYKEKELCEKTIKRNQERFKEYYIKTFINIEDANKHLKSIKRQLIDNLADYLKLDSISKSEKMKMIIFSNMPKTYCFMIRIKDSKKIEKIIGKLKMGRRKFLSFIYSTPLYKVEKRKIIFDNFNGSGYGCNPKYIAEEILKQGLDVDMVWVLKDLNEDIPNKIRKVKYKTLEAAREFATAKIWIDNVRDFKGVKKKKNQFYIQTWHASLGMKKVEGEIEKFLSPRYIKDAKYDGKITNLMFSNNDVETYIYKNHFWYTGQVMNIGVPRNDVLYQHSDELKRKVYDYFNIDYHKKIIIYAPTFRNNINIEDYQFDFRRCCNILNKKFNGEYVILLRLHPNISEYAGMLEYDDVVIDANHYQDMQELLAISEIGITDYSGIAFDMAMVGKPLFLICKDLDNYISNERGFAFSINELPFHFNKTEEELFDYIEKFSIEDYQENCNSFFEKIHLINTDHASKDVVEIIKRELS